MKNSIRILALIMALAACVGLFAACGSSKGEEESTPSDVTTANNAANNEASGTANNDNAPADNNAPADGESTAGGEETMDELYVAEVTKLNDDGTLALTLCTPVEGASGEISDYANVTMDDYVLSGSTVNYTVPDDAVISLAKDGTLTESSADTIAAGDRLIVYSQGGVSHIVIYPAG